MVSQDVCVEVYLYLPFGGDAEGAVGGFQQTRVFIPWRHWAVRTEVLHLAANRLCAIIEVGVGRVKEILHLLGTVSGPDQANEAVVYSDDLRRNGVQTIFHLLVVVGFGDGLGGSDGIIVDDLCVFDGVEDRHNQFLVRLAQSRYH